MAAYDFEVHVTAVSQGEIANFISGYLIFKGERLRFRALAYGRYGGQNVSPKLGPKVKRRLSQLGAEPGDFELQLQQKLLQGDFIIESKSSVGSLD